MKICEQLAKQLTVSDGFLYQFSIEFTTRKPLKSVWVLCPLLEVALVSALGVYHDFQLQALAVIVGDDTHCDTWSSVWLAFMRSTVMREAYYSKFPRPLSCRARYLPPGR